jgi:hypothetical protein
MIMRSSIDISPEFNDLYHSQVVNGYSYILDKKICVVGIARDVGSSIDNAVQKVLRLQSLCDNLELLIIENDSSDDTKNKLEKLKDTNNNFNYISKDFNLQKFGTVKNKERTIALANHRNTYIEYLNNSNKKYDYIIVCDWDFIDFNIDGLMNTF